MVVLVTSAINVVAPLTVLNNSEVRVNQLVKSVVKWLEKYPYVKIVICDGSGYDLSRSKLCQNKLYSSERLELISFNYDFELVRKYGKGNGEGQIIKYALNNSKFLRDADFFAKVTGRLFVNNAHYFFKNSPCNVFCQFNFSYKCILFPTNCKSMDTRFYVIRKDFYIDHFMNLYKYTDDINGVFLEHVFFEKMKSLLFEKHNIFFWSNFEIIGISGSTGFIYSDFSILRKIINVLRALSVFLIFKFFGFRIFKY